MATGGIPDVHADVSEEEKNAVRVNRLITKCGTQAVRICFDNEIPPIQLETHLKSNKNVLFPRKGRQILNASQIKQLFPGNQVRPGISSEYFDVTLMICILRNTTNLASQAFNWDELPAKTDESSVADLARMKWYRNKYLAHSPSCKLSTNEYQTVCADVCPAIDRLSNETLSDEMSKVLAEEIIRADDLQMLTQDIELLKTAIPQNKRETRLPSEILRMDKKSIDMYKQALNEGKETVNIIRVMVIGHFDVGKTTLTKRLLGDEVDINSRNSTDGIDIHKRFTVSLKDGQWTPFTEGSKTIEQRLLKVLVDHTKGNDAKEQPESADDATKEKHIEHFVKPDVDKDAEKDLKTKMDLQNIIQQSHVNEESADLSIWDFSGQYVFYTTHQEFLTPRAVYLLVTDMSSNIDNFVEKDKCNVDSSGPKTCKVSDFISLWMNSIHGCCPPGKCGVPPVILVGTHADKLDPGKRDKHFTDIRQFLSDKVTKDHLTDEDFAVDNAIVDPALDQLRKKILEVATQQDYWGELKPAKWSTLERALNKMRDKGLKIIKMSEVEAADKDMEAPLGTVEHLQLFLRFHHELGNVIYFSDTCLQDYVVLDPKWLIDAFKCLITAMGFFLKKHMEKVDIWKEFNNEAKLKLELIDLVWGKKENQIFKKHRDYLIDLMEKLNIIAKPSTLNEDKTGIEVQDYYYAPSILKEKAPSMYMTPSEDYKSTTILGFTDSSKFVHPALFNRLLAVCLIKWPIANQNDKNLIFCGCGIFEVDNKHVLTIYFLENLICIWVTKKNKSDPSVSVCTKVREFLEQTLSRIAQHFGLASKIETFVKCPEDKGLRSGFISVSEFNKDDDVPCKSCQERHCMVRSDMLRFWYGDDDLTQISPGETRLPIEILRMDQNSIDIYKQALAEGKETVNIIRVMVIGHFDVGKTTLTKRLLGDEVNINSRNSTDGIDIHKRFTVSLKDGQWTPSTEESKHIEQRLLKVIVDQTKVNDPKEQPESADDEKNSDDIPEQSPRLIVRDREGNRRKEHLEHTKTMIVSDITGYDPIEHMYSANIDIDSADSADIGIDSADSADIATKEKHIERFVKPDVDKDAEKDLKTKMDLQNIIQQGHVNEESADLSIWDFAGQYVFYTTHQVFLTPRAVYLLVTDMSSNIDNFVEKDECNVDSSGPKTCKVSDFISLWMNSIHGCCPPGKCGVPPVILVGTHADKLDLEKRDKHFTDIREFLSDKVTKDHLTDEDFAVDNAIVDPVLDKLRVKILEVAKKQEDYWGEQKPAKWITLEKALNKMRDKGLKIIKMSEVEAADKDMEAPLGTVEHLQLFLRFHHELGNVIYFSDTCLQDYVLLDPQWLIDAFKCLITANGFFLKKHLEKIDIWNEFNDEAKLKLELIDLVWGEKENQIYKKHRDHLIALMEKLNIIAKPSTLNEDKTGIEVQDYYYAPSILKEKAPSKYMTPSEDYKSTTILGFTDSSKFVHPALFNRLLAACLTKWPIEKLDNKNLIFCGCGIFEVDNKHVLTIYFLENLIRIWVTKFEEYKSDPSVSVCTEAREFVEQTLSRIAQHFGLASKIETFVKCRRDKGLSSGFISLSEFNKNDEVPCKSHQQRHGMVRSDMLRFWYGDDDLTQITPGGSYTRERTSTSTAELTKSISLRKVGSHMYYDTDKILGRGSSSQVYEGSLDGMKIAVKCIYCIDGSDATNTQGQIKTLYKEVEMMKKIEPHRNVNIVGYYDSHVQDDKLFIGFEFCQGTLRDYVKNEKPYTDFRIVFKPIEANRCIVNGLKFLHERGIVHRDLKPENIFIVHDRTQILKVVLGDFGSAKVTTDSLFSATGVVGTIGYIAPEAWDVIRKLDNDSEFKKYLTKTTDIFSLGILLYYSTTLGKHPYGNQMASQPNIAQGNPPDLDLLENKNDPLRQLLEKMLSNKAEDRPSSTAVCEHPALWNSKEILNFFVAKSDEFEAMVKVDSTKSSVLENAFVLQNGNWMRNMPSSLKSHLQKKVNGKKLYDGKGSSVRYLLRAIRNITNHFRDFPSDVQSELGSYPDGHADFWMNFCPKLLIRVYEILR